MTGRQSPNVSRRSAQKPAVIDRLFLRWMSTGHDIDGLWVGTTESNPHPALHRVEDALQLIKTQSPFHYARILRQLTRVWVHLVPSANALYNSSLNACVFDERFVLRQTTTLEEIASAIVHEATHARMDRWGVEYTERDRYRIEAICLRRELDLITKLPNSEALAEGIERTLEWCNTETTYFLDASFQERHEAGAVETLRYLKVPEWLISVLSRLRFFRTRPAQQAKSATRPIGHQKISLSARFPRRPGRAAAPG